MTITQDRELDIFVASTIGSIKHIKYHTDSSKNNKQCIENLVDIKSLRKEDAISCMLWGNTQQTDILIGKKNQQVEIYSTGERRVTWQYSGPWGDRAEGGVVGAGRSAGGALVAAVGGGAVRVWGAAGEAAELPHAGPLLVLRVLPGTDLYATGGDENELKVWDVERGVATFAAKSVPHDWLQLREPVRVSAVCCHAASGVLTAASGAGYVRSYDPRAQRRPVASLRLPGAAVCIDTTHRPFEYVVGLARGGMVSVDMRRGGGGGGAARGWGGAAGAVTDLCVVAGTQELVACSLDRHLRVYAGKGEMVYQQYLTSKLRSVLVQTETSTPLLCSAGVKEEREEGETEETDGADVPDDLDYIFDRMDTIGEKPKKSKVVSEEEIPPKKNKPSTEGSTADTTEDAIVQLLRSTEKTKRKREKMKREKRKKSVFHNA